MSRRHRRREPADLPAARARAPRGDARSSKLFTSDLSVNEFLLVREAGFDPLGLVMGTSIYQIAPHIPRARRATSPAASSST